MQLLLDFCFLWLKVFACFCLLIAISGGMFNLCLYVWAKGNITLYSDGLWQLIPIQAAFFSCIFMVTRTGRSEPFM
ncbi:hypothetical protein K6Y31_03995 [Motilimonas cestriensis]|uniref:Uncharacterized protein n=1 Tax=Motilimonas cestriensis TaxID=2742685 RepID=A0ABS8W9B2_9GAMM|nr:hypothetical protein [Motilimonas cestriensis]MCE2593975.1 hypothetical protein [Motilimonas cestriensis]